jgi:signal transduction histidine kinase
MHVLLCLKNKKNENLLKDYLSQDYSVYISEVEKKLSQIMDLNIIDYPVLLDNHKQIKRLSEELHPVFHPVILLLHREDTGLLKKNHWEVIDEIIFIPVEKALLAKRMELLSRAHNLSLKLKQRNDDLKAFIHAMAHDLRNPLTHIMGFSQLLYKYGEKKGEEEAGTQLQYLQRIHSGALKMNSIIESLLNYARLSREKINLKRINVEEVVRSSLYSLQEDINESKAQVALQIENITVVSDKVMLEMALTNLISNAIKYVNRGEKPEIEIRVLSIDNCCRIEIRDNGTGIPEEKRDKLFMPFTRLHKEKGYSGIGLGLSSVKRIIEILKGNIGVEFSPEQGSTFWIELPEP